MTCKPKFSCVFREGKFLGKFQEKTMLARSTFVSGQIRSILFYAALVLIITAIGSNAVSAADGDMDPAFSLTAFFNTGTVREMALQPDGSILLGGTFGMSGFGNFGQQFDYSRLNANGSLDPTFFTALTMSVKKYLVLSDGKLIVGGPGQNANNSTLIDVTRRNANSTYDSAFFGPVFDNIGISNYIEDMALQPDGKILVVGSFGGVASTARTSIMRLGTNGILDNTFVNPTFTFSTNPDAHRLRRVIVQPDGKILIAGGITQVNGVNRNLIARLNADGTLDTSFTPNLNGLILTDMVMQPDGKILVARNPSVVTGNPVPANVMRLNTDGSVDGSFTTAAEQILVQTIALQPDGKVLIGGTFSTVRGAARNGVARLNADGTLDATLIPNVPVAIHPNKLVVQPDGKILASIDQPFNKTYAVIRLKGTYAQNISSVNRLADFDGDGKADTSVYRASAGMWYGDRSTAGFFATQFGIATDKAAAADYDGDGKTDIAVWRENANQNYAYFYVLNSATNSIRIEQFGLTGDKLMSGDWDGDGKADLAVYRDSGPGTQSYFYYRGSLNNPNGIVTYLPWGISGDMPMLGDFDGDGKLDAAVFRPSNQTWYIRQSSNGQVRYDSFGLATDRFVPADYDGDGKMDLAVFRNGLWYISQSSNGQIRYQSFGLATDTLVPADYDGDGKTDIATYRNGVWYVLPSTSGSVTYRNFGNAGDTPIPFANQ